MSAISITPQLESIQIVNHIGGGSLEDMSHAAKQKLLIIKRRFADLVKSDIHYRSLDINSIDSESVSLSTGMLFNSRMLARTLRPCHKVVVFVATIGSKLETEASELESKGRSSIAYILDAVGSVAVENTVEQFQKLQAKGFKRESRHATLRFSPGYCDWPIEEQKKLFSLFNGEKLPVQLSDTCLMRPRKSISGIFGVTPPIMSSFSQYNPCKDCGKTSCDGRRARSRLMRTAM